MLEGYTLRGSLTSAPYYVCVCVCVCVCVRARVWVGGWVGFGEHGLQG